MFIFNFDFCILYYFVFNFIHFILFHFFNCVIFQYLKLCFNFYIFAFIIEMNLTDSLFFFFFFALSQHSFACFNCLINRCFVLRAGEISFNGISRLRNWVYIHRLILKRCDIVNCLFYLRWTDITVIQTLKSGYY